MKNYLLLFALCFAMVSCQENSTQNNNTNSNTQAAMEPVENPDADFAKKAAEAGMFEVKLGELAQTKGTSVDVKNFGQQMKDDHTKANDELKAFAQTKGIELPMALSEEKQKDYDDFAQKSAADFDKDYADHMVKGHKKVIDAFEKEAADGKDADLKNWASGKLQTLKHHLEMAEQMETH